MSEHADENERDTMSTTKLPYFTVTGNRGHGVTHLHSVVPRKVTRYGETITTVYVALCGARASAAAVDGPEVNGMPTDVRRPCAKCSERVRDRGVSEDISDAIRKANAVADELVRVRAELSALLSASRLRDLTLDELISAESLTARVTGMAGA